MGRARDQNAPVAAATERRLGADHRSVRPSVAPKRTSTPTAELLLALQASVGNRAVASLAHQERHGPTLGRVARETNRDAPFAGSISSAVPTTRGYTATIQRAGLVEFTNLTASPEFGAKAAELITVLQDSDWIRTFLGPRDADITLVQESQPATVTAAGNGNVQITLATWFFENQSVGRVVGMLAHEFGVHPIGSEYVGFRAGGSEDNVLPMQTGRGTDTIDPSAAGQRDHAFAAVEGQVRHDAYRETTLSLAMSMMDKDPTNIRDTIMTYLADVAMILATNDWRPGIVLHPSITAEYFNLERGRWLTWLGVVRTDARSDAERDVIDTICDLTPPEQGALDVIWESMSAVFFLAYDQLFGGASMA